MLSNDLRSLHILSKTRLSIPHLLGGGGQNFKCVLQGGEENFLTLPLQENYIPPTHRKNDTSLSRMVPKYSNFSRELCLIKFYSRNLFLLSSCCRLFGSSGTCYGCLKSIAGNELVQKINGNVYHLQCFRCSSCKKQLRKGDKLYISSDRGFICEDDFTVLLSGKCVE